MKVVSPITHSSGPCRPDGSVKGTSLNSASLTPKPLASSVYVHVPEAPSPLKRSISVMSFFLSRCGQDERAMTWARITCDKCHAPIYTCWVKMTQARGIVLLV